MKLAEGKSHTFLFALTLYGFQVFCKHSAPGA
jgi:hypothetical protein